MESIEPPYTLGDFIADCENHFKMRYRTDDVVVSLCDADSDVIMYNPMYCYNITPNLTNLSFSVFIDDEIYTYDFERIVEETKLLCEVILVTKNNPILPSFIFNDLSELKIAIKETIKLMGVIYTEALESVLNDVKKCYVRQLGYGFGVSLVDKNGNYLLLR